MLREHNPDLETDVKPEIDQRAHVIALEALADIDGRARGGDLFAGARAAGLSDEAAHDLAVQIAGDPLMADLIAVDGGLLVGAQQALYAQERQNG
ncbi:MAG: hypothetical protein QG553_197 [Patescibacteria group bacterium]|nr:hypothetical protein [Patescibacteria group bacterium]